MPECPKCGWIVTLCKCKEKTPQNYEEKCLECKFNTISHNTDALYECEKGIDDADGCGCEFFEERA